MRLGISLAQRMLAARPGRWLARVVLYGLATWFLFHVFEDAFKQIGQSQVLVDPAAIGLAIVLLATWYFVISAAWRRFVQESIPGSSLIPTYEFNMASAKALVARYIPGKITYIAARAEHLAPQGMSARSAWLSSIQEQISFHLASSVVALLALPLTYHWVASQVPLVIIFASLCLAAILLTGWLFRPDAGEQLILRLIHRVTKSRVPYDSSTTFSRPALRRMFLWHCVATILEGAAAVALLAPIFQAYLTPPIALAMIGAYPLARLLGQFAIVLPAGVGVREALFVILVGATVGQPAALTAAILMRLVTAGIDIVGLIVAWLLAGWSRKRIAGSKA